MADIRSRIFRASLWISAARLLTNLLSAVSVIILARLLVPADFGLVALATAMLAVIQAFTDLSMAQALIHTHEPTPDHYNTVWTMGLIRGLVIGSGFAIAAPFLAEAYSEPRLQNVMLVMAVGAVISSLSNPKMVVLQKQLSFHQESIRSIIAVLLRVGVAISVAFYFRTYWALVAGTLAGQITNLVYSYTLVPFRPAIGWKYFSDLWRFSFWVSLGQIVDTLNYRFDYLLVGTFLGRVDLGLYTVGSRISIIPGREITRPLTRTLFPAFKLAAADPARFLRAYQRTQGVVTALALPTSVGFGLVADPVVRLALGDAWLNAIPIVQLLAVIYSIDTFGSLVNPLGLATGQARLLFIRTLQKLAIRAPLIVVGLIAGGLMGLLYARATAGVIGVLVDMAMIRRLTKLSILQQFRANLRTILATACMAVTVVLCQRFFWFGEGKIDQLLTLGCAVLLGILTYVCSLWLLWRANGRPNGPEKEMIEMGTKLLRIARGQRRRPSPVEGN